MLTLSCKSGKLWLLILGFAAVLTSCKNDPTPEKGTETAITGPVIVLKDVHFDCGMFMGNEQMMYLKYNNSATGLGPVSSCNSLTKADFKSSNIPEGALAACVAESAEGTLTYYAMQDGEVLNIYRQNPVTQAFQKHLLVPLR